MHQKLKSRNAQNRGVDVNYDKKREFHQTPLYYSDIELLARFLLYFSLIFGSIFPLWAQNKKHFEIALKPKLNLLTHRHSSLLSHKISLFSLFLVIRYSIDLDRIFVNKLRELKISVRIRP